MLADKSFHVCLSAADFHLFGRVMFAGYRVLSGHFWFSTLKMFLRQIWCYTCLHSSIYTMTFSLPVFNISSWTPVWGNVDVMYLEDVFLSLPIIGVLWNSVDGYCMLSLEILCPLFLQISLLFLPVLLIPITCSLGYLKVSCRQLMLFSFLIPFLLFSFVVSIVKLSNSLVFFFPLQCPVWH